MFPNMTSLSGGAPIGDIGGSAGPSSAGSTTNNSIGGFQYKTGGTSWTTIALIIAVALVAVFLLR